MKLSQIVNRLLIKMGGGCTLGVVPSDNYTNIELVNSPQEIDFDPVFLERFSVDRIMSDEFEFLHSIAKTDLKTKWQYPEKTQLWNFNLHYFEYLFPLINAWEMTGERRYLDRTTDLIQAWIDVNRAGSKPGWASYTISMRVINWINYYGHVYEALMPEFRNKFLQSLHEQYRYLCGHLERDILGNHYFENLKCLVIASIFFKENDVMKKALECFKAECREEILADGMHFELSPMYHKIILEGMLRVSLALRGRGRTDAEIDNYLKPMLDVAYSFEEGLDRVPLFNDSGNNVSKSLRALKQTARRAYGLVPNQKDRLEASGFYFFVRSASGHKWKLIVDAGAPGPRYIPGHAHCDAMSYELFRDGKPIVVNCGTYAYQCEERSFFRSTSAHNTVKIDGNEQSQCWGTFRMAKKSEVRILSWAENTISMKMRDAYGKTCIRTISLGEDALEVTDETQDATLDAYIHITEPVSFEFIGEKEDLMQPYAVEYGRKENVCCYHIRGRNRLMHKIMFKDSE